MITKLDAVNQILESIGEDPVSSLSSGLPDAEAAERILDRISREVQAKGWLCNTEREYTLSLTNDKTIPLSDDILRIDTVGVDKGLNVTVRKYVNQAHLYNIADHSFTFNKALTVDIILNRDIAELPPELQMYIVSKASRRFQESELGSIAADQFAVRAEQEAYAALLDAEAEAEDSNVLTDSLHCRYVTGRNHPLYGR